MSPSGISFSDMYLPSRPAQNTVLMSNPGKQHPVSSTGTGPMTIVSAGDAAAIVRLQMHRCILGLSIHLTMQRMTYKQRTRTMTCSQEDREVECRYEQLDSGDESKSPDTLLVSTPGVSLLVL